MESIRMTAILDTALGIHALFQLPEAKLARTSSVPLEIGLYGNWPNSLLFY